MSFSALFVLYMTMEPPKNTRVPAAERRAALIEAALEEFGATGYHGTPVGRIAGRVGVAQPYVFSLFETKRDLFIAAVALGFGRVSERFESAARDFEAGESQCEDIFEALGQSYMALVESQRSVLMTQLQAYAACDDPVIRAAVQELWTGLSQCVQRLTGAGPEKLVEFFSLGMWLTVRSAIGLTDPDELCPPGMQAKG